MFSSVLRFPSSMQRPYGRWFCPHGRHVHSLLLASLLFVFSVSIAGAQTNFTMPRYHSNSGWELIELGGDDFNNVKITGVSGGSGYVLNLVNNWGSSTVFSIDIGTGGDFAFTPAEFNPDGTFVLGYITHESGASPSNFQATVQLTQGAGEGGSLEIDESSFGNLNGSLYELLQFNFQFSELPSPDYEALHRFNYERFDVHAEFTSGGTTHVMPAFYRADEANPWSVRYSPLSAGNYQYKVVAKAIDDNGNVTDQTETQTYSLNVSASTIPGFVERSPTHPRRLQYSNGEAFVMIGCNTAWSEGDVNRDHDPGMSYTFETMADQNMNTARIFINTGWEPTALEWGAGNSIQREGIDFEYKGLGEYQLENAARMDNTFQTAMDSDVHIIVALRNFIEFRSLTIPGNDWWDKSAYNSKNPGGHCPNNGGQSCVIAGTASDANISRRFFKRYMRYVFARYGSYRSFGITEMFNEIDNEGDFGGDVFALLEDSALPAWQNEMASTWRSFDFYPRMLTTSYSFADHVYDNGYVDAESWPSLSSDFTIRNSHMYYPNDESERLSNPNYGIPNGTASGGQDPRDGGGLLLAPDAWIYQLRFLQTGEDAEFVDFDQTTPSYIEEYGPFYEPRSTDAPQGEFNSFYADGAWIPFFFAESAGTNLIWKVDDHFAPSEESAAGYRFLGDFLKDERNASDGLPTLNHVLDVTVSNPQNLKCAGYTSSTKALLLVRDYTASADWEVLSPPLRSNTTCSLPGMQNGNYQIEFCSPEDGPVSTANATVTNGTLTINVPDFKRTIAIKVKQGTAVESCDLALNKPTTASSDGLWHPSGQGNDGDEGGGNYWASGDSSAASSNWEVNLEQSATVTKVGIRVGVHWQQMFTPTSGTYKVQYLSGSTWTNVPGVPEVDYVPWKAFEYTLPTPITAQKWRVVYSNPNGNSYFGMNEFTLCGSFN